MNAELIDYERRAAILEAERDALRDELDLARDELGALTFIAAEYAVSAADALGRLTVDDPICTCRDCMIRKALYQWAITLRPSIH